MKVFPPEGVVMFEYRAWVVQSGYAMAGTEKAVDEVLNEHADEGWRLVFAIPSGSRGILLIFERERQPGNRSREEAPESPS
jgi:hypothetical protein